MGLNTFFSGTTKNKDFKIGKTEEIKRILE